MRLGQPHANLATAPPGSAAPSQPTKSRRLAREWLSPLILVLLVMIPARSMIGDWNDVPSGSMRPTILEGDRITVNKLAFGLRIPFSRSWLWTWGQPNRGDIVTFASPADGTRLVKRVIGLPGDRIEMRNNVLFINTHSLNYQPDGDEVLALLPDRRPTLAQPYTESACPADPTLPQDLAAHTILLTPAVRGISNFPELTIPPDSFFMLGDNRDVSNDSRVYGVVPRANIFGKVDYIALSLDPRDSYWPRWERWGLEVK